MNPSAGWLLREIDRAADAAAIRRLDTSYTTEAIYAATAENDSLRLELRPTASRSGRFPIDLDQPEWDRGFVAVEDGMVRGFIATRFAAWNRRLTIWHFYVDRNHRRQGIGRTLMERAIEAGRQSGARMAWAETSNVNAPGIEAYRRLGFFDLRLRSDAL